ncbi:MAG: antibiotic biosynthesis monooxygenase [Acidobacteriota bacterium]|nr:antibiotic biosynthesis monooxygenase [Acidobacteriota bacterium]
MSFTLHFTREPESPVQPVRSSVDMVTVIAEMVARAGREADLKTELLQMVEATRPEEGCVQYDLHVSTKECGHFLFYENWTTQEALDRHAASAHLKAFGTIASELLAEPVRVSTFTRLA